MRLIIAGDRNFADASVFALGISLCPWMTDVSVVLSGACGLDESIGMRRPPYAAGADGFGEAWADLRKITLERHFAKWKQRGKRAGPERNRLMASLADALVIFPGGGPGSASMLEAARAYDLHIVDAMDAVRALRARSAGEAAGRAPTHLVTVDAVHEARTGSEV